KCRRQVLSSCCAKNMVRQSCKSSRSSCLDFLPADRKVSSVIFNAGCLVWLIVNNPSARCTHSRWQQSEDLSLTTYYFPLPTTYPYIQSSSFPVSVLPLFPVSGLCIQTVNQYSYPDLLVFLLFCLWPA